LFDTESEFETGYRTWLATQGGELSRGAVTSSAETDVTRLQWMRWTVLILWQTGETSTIGCLNTYNALEMRLLGPKRYDKGEGQCRVSQRTIGASMKLLCHIYFCLHQ
jgi:hypothetical protein